MRILITGLSGFIGSALYHSFDQQEHELYTIDNLSFGNRALISIPDENFFVADIRNRSRVLEIVRQIRPEIVIHLAAIHFIPYCNAHPFEAAEVNIQGTRNLLEACSATGSVRKLFYASTAAVYPVMEGPISESVQPHPTDIYGLSKLSGEYICEAFHYTTGCPTVICRFFNAFGPNETNPHLIPVIQEQVNAGKREISLGNLEPRRDFIHTHDMARAIIALLDCFEEGLEVFNLGRGVEYSVLEIVQAFEACLEEKIGIHQDPARIRKSDRMHLLADISKIKAFTGWSPAISIESGIKTLIGA
jgi:UDP-glucose 4-epimerase